MKGTLVAILVLSLGVWTFFYLSYPGEPPNSSETAVLVGLCAGVVLLSRWAWSRLRKKPGGDGHAS